METYLFESNNYSLKQLKTKREFLKTRIYNYLEYAENTLYNENDNDMYNYYINESKKIIDRINKINLIIKGI